jgi:predicted metal-dependent hydrolase
MTRLSAPLQAIVVDGLSRPVPLRRSARARRLSLKIDTASGRPVVVAPPALSVAVVRDFVARHADWVRRHQAAEQPGLSFRPGASIPCLGRDLLVVHDPSVPRRAILDGGCLLVGGPAEHVAARVEHWLIGQAKHELTARTLALAARLGKTVAAVSVRDTKSRWGSCAAGGRMAYCWRLILAPEAVLDYVVAHEVAHLVEMNHSPRFWAAVAGLHPDVPGGRAWLKANGARLHRYGRTPAAGPD